MHKKFSFSAFLSFCLIFVSSCFVVVFLAVPSQVLTSEPLLPQCSSRHPYPQQRNIYTCKRFTVFVPFFLFMYIFFFFLAVPSQVSTSEPLLPCCSSQHPYPQQRNNIYMYKRFTVLVLFFLFSFFFVFVLFLAVPLCVNFRAISPMPLILASLPSATSGVYSAWRPS